MKRTSLTPSQRREQWLLMYRLRHPWTEERLLRIAENWDADQLRFQKWKAERDTRVELPEELK